MCLGEDDAWFLEEPEVTSVPVLDLETGVVQSQKPQVG